MRDSANLPDYFINVVEDISKRKEAEEKLASTLEALKRSNAELEQFAHVASHDLQEPLRTISSYLDLLVRRCSDQLDDKAQNYIVTVKGAAKRMMALIDDLLTFSRVTSKGQSPEPVDMGKILEDVLKNLDAAITESGAEIIAGNLPVVNADSSQLSQVLQNLVGNAIKFHGDAPPEIRISATQENSEWVFAVQDNGIGIDPAQFGHIFKLFQRLHSRDEYPGTGIGLAVCKRIVERHGGRIWVESIPGNGSTFYFTLPVTKPTPLK
jgi:light-regulated signal transduction histidine kinase (bacteriophytochrome)